MSDCVINAKVTSKNVVIEIPKDFIINDFGEMYEGFRVKGNRKNKFLKEIAEELREYIINEEVLVNIYDSLSDSDNVKCIDDEYY